LYKGIDEAELGFMAPVLAYVLLEKHCVSSSLLFIHFVN
jgi:hypothetical protein